MAVHVCENINEDLFVIINKLFSTKYPIDIFDLTNWSKLIILLPCFQRFSLFSKVYLKSKLWLFWFSSSISITKIPFPLLFLAVFMLFFDAFLSKKFCMIWFFFGKFFSFIWELVDGVVLFLFSLQVWFSGTVQETTCLLFFLENT